uniref:EB domain-containing protein n=1 Tax=Romanomermis culicivorax TaxID=13658 RepID=A0A915JQ39_ROMCU
MLWNLNPLALLLAFLSLISLVRQSESVPPSTLPLVRKIDIADCPSLDSAEGNVFLEDTPTLFSQCRGVCQKPAQCVPYTGDDAKGRNVSVCLCQSPFVLQDGQCSLQCPKDSYYNSDKGLCAPACKATEVKSNDGICLPLVDLNSNCKTQEQCQAVNSHCKSGVCTCRDGFVSQKGTCVPRAVNCPFGDALKAKDGSFQQCVISFTDPSIKPGSPNNSEKPSWGQKVTPKDNCPKEDELIPNA